MRNRAGQRTLMRHQVSVGLVRSFGCALVRFYGGLDSCCLRASACRPGGQDAMNGCIAGSHQPVSSTNETAMASLTSSFPRRSARSITSSKRRRTSDCPGFGVRLGPALGVGIRPGHGVRLGGAIGGRGGPGVCLHVQSGRGVRVGHGYRLGVPPDVGFCVAARFFRARAIAARDSQRDRRRLPGRGPARRLPRRLAD